jgi:RNA polymerase sigma-70 factor (ECF subfamily)
MNRSLNFVEAAKSRFDMNPDDYFETIVNEHYEGLFRFAMSLTRAESDAWDLTQHTFYTWATKGHQLSDISKVKSWLFTTLHRAFLMALRKQNRFTHYDLEEVLDQLPAVSPGVATQSDCCEVLRALAKLDEVYQAAVALFYLEDYSYKEIAEILEVPVGTIKSRIARGIGQLRTILLSDRGDTERVDVDQHASPTVASPIVVQEPQGAF